jgi:hypothetical protein
MLNMTAKQAAQQAKLPREMILLRIENRETYMKW